MARPLLVLWVSPLFVVPGGEAGLLVLALTHGGWPWASLPSWPSPRPPRRRRHRGEPPASPPPRVTWLQGAVGRHMWASEWALQRVVGYFWSLYSLHIWELPMWDWGGLQGDPCFLHRGKGWG